MDKSLLLAMVWGWEGFFSFVLFVVSISSMSILSFILWSCSFLEFLPIWWGKFVSWNLWNKNGCFGYWIGFMWLLISGLNVVDAVLCIRFDCYGRQGPDLVLLCLFGIGIWLRTEQHGFVILTQVFGLVSLNQSQASCLERSRVLIIEMKEKIWQQNYGKRFHKSRCKRVLCAFYTLARMVEIQHGETVMALRNLLGVKQRLIILFLKTSTIMAVSKFWSFFVIWCFGFQGIIKPKLVNFRSFFKYFLNEDS